MEKPVPARASLGSDYELCRKVGAEIPNTAIYVPDPNIPALRPLLQTTLGFVSKTSNMMGNEFVNRYRANRQAVLRTEEPATLPFLTKNNLHLPQFGIFDSTSAPDFLDETPFPEETEIADGNLLLVFQFPQLIDRYYHHRYDLETDHLISVVNWATIGHRLKKIVWDNIKLYSTESAKLSFEKINDTGEHEHKLFHYVWEVSLPQSQR